MPSEWIIDVLADLRSYAEKNGMPATAASLEDATLIALAEAETFQAHVRSGMDMALRTRHDGDGGNVTWLFARRDLV